jgi:putative flavoprotein involved in K+ transport
MEDQETAMGLGSWLLAFSQALARGDATATAALFDKNGFWRDMVAFTWDIRTFEGGEAIQAMLEASPDAFKASNWRATGLPGAEQATEGFITFQTALGRGEGYVRLLNGKCLTLLTSLTELRGFEERRGPTRPLGAEIDPARPKANWKDLLEIEAAEVGYERQPYVLIVGGGQGGLGLAARLRQLKVPTLVIDRHARAGDQWRYRYRSLSLHDPVWYDHMPYLPFPDTWPVFTPKDKIADWLEAYVRTMELNVWGSTDCVKARYDEDLQEWRVQVRRNGQDMVLRPKHLVIATGNAGKPNTPTFMGAETFNGDILHSSQHPGGEGFGDRRVAVIGSNNSAHDICADLAAHGADVTMVQRSPTHVIRSQTFMELMLSGAYSEQAVEMGLSTEKADLLSASMPLRILPEIYRSLNQEVARRDADFYARLEAAGFMHTFGEDGTGLALMYLRRAAGYYIDVGASELIAAGAIKLRAGVGVDHIEPDGIVLSDGEKLLADTIICATGFGSMDEWAAELISPEVAKTVGKVWGYGSDTIGDPGPWEGELRNMWKPTRQRGLWFHGGNLAQSRFYSRVLALQLKARFEDLDFAVHAPRDHVLEPA